LPTAYYLSPFTGANTGMKADKQPGSASLSQAISAVDPARRPSLER